MLFHLTRAKSTRSASRSTASVEPSSEIIDRCSALGRAGYAAGHHAPAQDSALMAIIREHGKGMPVGWVIPLLDAWNAAWHEEHLRQVALSPAQR